MAFGQIKDAFRVSADVIGHARQVQDLF
jgi:hypothetical protein